MGSSYITTPILRSSKVHFSTSGIDTLLLVFYIPNRHVYNINMPINNINMPIRDMSPQFIWCCIIITNKLYNYNYEEYA